MNSHMGLEQDGEWLMQKSQFLGELFNYESLIDTDKYYVINTVRFDIFDTVFF